MHSASSAPAAVLFEDVRCAGDYRIGFAQLNAEKSLNALTHEMIRDLYTQLLQWSQDPGIACVVLSGAGEKAFCAGGDIRSLYRIVQAERQVALNQTVAFFADEYRLDYFIHRYPKPLLVWGSGIVFGGGLGLMAGASHRVVTETSRVGMPEISIGLFPDVGASGFLPRLPGRAGLFIALTGAQLNAHDAIVGRLADYFVRSEDRQRLFARLREIQWSADNVSNRGLLSAVLADLAAHAASALPVSNLQQHAQVLDELCEGDDLQTIVTRIVSYDGADTWLKRAAATLAAGCPTTAALAWELQRRARSLSLADVFRLELMVAVQCCLHPNLREGVRALLIDKDNTPRWTPPTLAEVTPRWLEEHFSPPWRRSDKFPLADLS